jgi:hypothetical protein
MADSCRPSIEHHALPTCWSASACPQVSERRHDAVLVAAGNPPVAGVNLGGGCRGPAGFLPLGEGADVTVSAPAARERRYSADTRQDRD